MNSSSFFRYCACWTRCECSCATVGTARCIFLSALISRLVRELAIEPDAICSNLDAANYGKAVPAEKHDKDISMGYYNVLQEVPRDGDRPRRSGPADINVSYCH